MREIKFRGKRFGDHEHWIYGTLTIDPLGNFYIHKKLSIDNLPVKPKTVSQFIAEGKFGVEYYEGDILWDERNECYWVLSWDDELHAFRREELTPDGRGVSESAEMLDEDIIGNLWDTNIDELFESTKEDN